MALSVKTRERIGREYSFEERASIEELLSSYNEALGERDRVHNLILKLARGNPQKVASLIEEANKDPRDVLAAERSPQEIRKARIFIVIAVIVFLAWKLIEYVQRVAT